MADATCVCGLQSSSNANVARSAFLAVCSRCGETTVRREKGPVGQFYVPAVWLARQPSSQPGKTTNMNNSLAGARIRLALSLTHILHVWARGEEDEEEFR